MMTLGMDISENLEISADGSDEDAAIEGLISFLEGIEE